MKLSNIISRRNYTNHQYKDLHGYITRQIWILVVTSSNHWQIPKHLFTVQTICILKM